jgi:hypothetical protein
MRKSGLVTLGLLALGLAGPGRAEVCTAEGTHVWTAVGAGGWACDATGDDDFVLDSPDDLVFLAGDITLSTGSISCSAGELVIGSGVTLAWTGPDDDTQEILIEDDCVFTMQGGVKWEGRLASVAWGGGTTPQETRLGLPAATPIGVAPGDFVHFAWDDFEPFGEPISQPVQTDPGQPSGNQLHPSYNVGQFWRISAVGTNWIDAFHSTEQDLDLLDGVRDGTPAFEPPGIGGLATSSYIGTRALVAGVVPSAMEIGKHGMFTRLRVPASTGATDGDFGSRYVTWESGQCQGQRWKVVGFEDENAGFDVVIVAGDASECELSSFALTTGAGPGDLVRIVERPTIDGNDVAHIRIRGGELRWSYARLVRLDKIQLIQETPTLFAKCALCIYQESATQQIAAGSTMDFMELAYTEDDFEGTFLVSLISEREALNGFDPTFTRRFDNLLDLCGVSTRGWWIHDEHGKYHDPGGIGDGTHGIKSGAGCLDLRGVRVERVGDDGLFLYTSHLGGPNETLLTLRLPILYENMAEGDTSQECLVLQTQAFGEGDLNTVNTNAVVEDLVAIGCDETNWISNGLGHSYDRVVVGSASLETPGSFGAHIDLSYAGLTETASSGCSDVGLPSACCTGTATGTCTFPLRGVERFPNRISNMILFPFVPDGIPSIQQRFNGVLRDSVVAVSNAGNHNLNNLYGAEHSLLSLRGDFPPAQKQYGAIYPADSNPDVTNANAIRLGPDLVLVNEFTGAADTFCAVDFDPIGLKRLVFERFWYLGFSSASAGWLTGCEITSGLQVEADGLILSSAGDAFANGQGLGQTALTGGGALVRNACIEAYDWVDPEGPNGFGPNRTPSSFHRVPPFEPDSDDDLPLRAYSVITGEGNGCFGPRRFGLRELGSAHVLGLGDGGLRQLDRFSTLDLPGAQIPAPDGAWRALGALALAGVGALALRRIPRSTSPTPPRG